MTEQEAVEEMTDIWVRASELMYRVQRANGGGYLHVLQPNQYVPGSKPLTDKEKRVAYRPEKSYARWAQAGYELFARKQQRLLAEGVPFLDATSLFKGNHADLYVDPCCHFNRQGNEMLLEEIVEFIRAKELLAEIPAG